MEQVKINQTFGERIEKSPPFAKNIVIVFSDDVSVDTMQKFNEGESKELNESLIKEGILDWNLYDEKNNKLPITMESLDRIKSIKLRNWIIGTLTKVVIESLTLVKKK